MSMRTGPVQILDANTLGVLVTAIGALILLNLTTLTSFRDRLIIIIWGLQR